MTVPTGFRVLPGKNVTTNAQASDPALGKVVAVAAADLTAIGKELTAATGSAAGSTSSLAANYTTLYNGNTSTVLGAGPNSAGSSALTPSFVNPTASLLPTPLASPLFHGRATGGVTFGTVPLLINPRLGQANSFRGDEGQPIIVSSILKTGNHLVVRAPVSGSVSIGNNFQAGDNVVVWGSTVLTAAGTAQPAASPPAKLGDKVTLQSGVIVDESTIGANSTIGARSYIAGSTLPANSNVPPGTILIQNKVVGSVEW